MKHFYPLFKFYINDSNGKIKSIQKIMGAEYDGIDRGMDVHISRIRRKLQKAGFDSCRLKSVRSMGYLLAYR